MGPANPNIEETGFLRELRNRNDDVGRGREMEGAGEGVGEWVPVIGRHHEEAVAAHCSLQSEWLCCCCWQWNFHFDLRESVRVRG